VIVLKDVFRLHGKALTILRITNGRQVSEVAAALGVSVSFVTACEKNRKKLSEDKTKKFLEYIGTSETEAKAFFQIIENN
jgi:DNA-binding transcriptional regulator YiaG